MPSPSPVLSLLLTAAAVAAPLTPEQQALLKGGSRHDRDGWVYLHVEGGARARGFQHGYLLAPEIRRGIKGIRTGWEHKTGTPWERLLTKASVFFLPGVDPECLSELKGMAEGLGAAGVATSALELAVYNGSTELSEYWWPQELNRIRSEKTVNHPRESCSAFIAVGSYTRDGRIVMGHNQMCGYQDPLGNLVLDILPDRGHRILMQGVAGWIHSGADFFVTDAGIVGCETTIGDFQPYEPGGIPEFVRMRRATQDASSLDAWCAIMKKGNNGGYANAWLLGDIRSNEIVRLELGLRYVGFERTRDGFFTGSNIAEDPRILRFETTTRETDIGSSKVARRLRWRELMAAFKGRIDAGAAKAFEADHRDVARGEEHPGGRSLCGHFELEAEPLWDAPYEPAGTTDAKVLDSTMAARLSFAARAGSACGRPFHAGPFLLAHPQFDWLKEILPDRPSQEWTVFTAGEGPR